MKYQKKINYNIGFQKLNRKINQKNNVFVKFKESTRFPVSSNK